MILHRQIKTQAKTSKQKMTDPWSMRNSRPFMALGAAASGRGSTEADKLAKAFVGFMKTLHIGNLELDRSDISQNSIRIRSTDRGLTMLTNDQMTAINQRFRGVRVEFPSGQGVEFTVPYGSETTSDDDGGQAPPVQVEIWRELVHLAFLGCSVYVLLASSMQSF
jgi:hypothetical protein